jgi:hypothetical protein
MPGTPKTLNEAISNGLYSFGLGNRESPAPLVIEAHVRDFIAQKFGAAMLNTSDDALAFNTLANLWEKIIGEPYNERGSERAAPAIRD